MNIQSDQINELISALAKAQGEIRNANKSSINPHFKSKYADLSEVWDACREPLSKNGLAVVQTMMKDGDGSICLITTLAHSSGQWMKSIFPMACKDPNNPQAWGSSCTYSRRYCLSAIVGIAPDEDDDGNKASIPKPREEKLKKIGKEQWTDLNKLIDQCDSDFQQKIWDRLSALGIQSMADLDEDTFRKMRDACLGNISKQSKKENESTNG